MSAMHWEARRRQAMLDRRSRTKQAKEDPAPPVPKQQSSPDTTTQPAEERGCAPPIGAPPSSGPRDPGTWAVNRYNSLQYAQQW